MIRRVGLVYDHRPRSETTGFYCLRALESLVDVAHLHPEQLSYVSPHEFDLYLCVDEGLAYPWPDLLRPAAYWAIDTHLDFARSLRRSRSFDLVLAAQQNGSQALQRELSRSVPWLPLACDPELHRLPQDRKEYDWAFVGNLFPGPRQELLERLQEEFPRRFVGRAYFLQMARIYACSKIVFNRSVRDDLNMRVFEALASGSLLITNELPGNGLEELFQDGTHLVTYRSQWDLLEQMHWYLEHERERELIARRGQQEILGLHTYRHRMQTLLQLAEQRFSPRSAQPSPLSRKGQANAASPSVPMAVPQESNTMRESISPQKTADYYRHERREVLALVPETARRVLDIGCGGGRLGALIRQRQPAEVVGIELNPQAAALARQHLDEVHELDLEGPLPEWAPGSFDTIIAADILEHLRQPQTLLKQLHRLLREDGQLIVSLPNVRHHSVIRSLLNHRARS